MPRPVKQRLHDILSACDFILRHTNRLTLDDCRQSELIRSGEQRATHPPSTPSS